MSRTVKQKKQKRTPSPTREPVPHAVAVGRVISALHARNAYAPERFVSAFALSEATGLTVEEVVDAAKGIRTDHYAVLVKRYPIRDGAGFYLAESEAVKAHAEVLRDEARELKEDAKEWDALAMRMECGFVVGT